MSVEDKNISNTQVEGKQKYKNAEISNHLANERTFLAWIRTGLATISIGFVVARFGLFLRELGLKSEPIPYSSLHYSMVFGVALSVTGIVAIVIALMNFLQVRRDIEQNTFHSRISYVIVLTVLAVLIGVLLSFYLLFSS
jgi:putative membrane protein